MGALALATELGTDGLETGPLSICPGRATQAPDALDEAPASSIASAPACSYVLSAPGSTWTSEAG